MPIVHRIHAFSDNYIWCIENNGDCALVDPGDAAPCIEFIEQKELKLKAVLITHHHFDHTGGLDDLHEYAAPVVYGPIKSHPRITQDCTEGKNVEVIGCNFQVMAVPGHTLDHIAFFNIDQFNQPTLFCGDTLFAGGCGRLFEGTPAQMHQSLQSLAALPSNTLVYCAHEYTEANLHFALSVEPQNQQLQQRAQSVAKMRQSGEATVPSSLKTELETNPFLRVNVTSFKTNITNNDNVRTYSDAELFAEIRHRKDNF